MRSPQTQRFNLVDLLFYCLIAFGWSWLCWLGSTLVLPSAGIASAILGILGSFGPSVAAIVLAARRSDVRSFLIRAYDWRIRWIWYAIAFFFPAVLMSIALGLYELFSGTLPHSPASGRGWLVVVNFILVLLMGGPLGEELGWRGYLLPRLQARFNALWSSLILGLIWSSWHLPLFLIPGTVQQQLPIVPFYLNTIALSFLFSWLWAHTRGSVVLAIVFHTGVNGWSWVIPILPNVAHSLRPYYIGTILLWVTAVLVMSFSHPQKASRSV
ncbi:CPBP family intramembrane glutamic endopeptidase [Leptolyngbya sp. AN03gr2]|uniref:CPBP family intramembrane glutamic endopeptidase n=1 Tax=unclassified Leptolyngbya TaxID=2650499 RepID=UPI003D314EDE